MQKLVTWTLGYTQSCGREKYEQKQRELEMKDKILQNKIRDFFNKINQLKDQKNKHS